MIDECFYDDILLLYRQFIFELINYVINEWIVLMILGLHADHIYLHVVDNLIELD